MGKKRKKFRPVKVGNRGYMPGRRQRMFSFPPQSAARKKAAPDATNIQSGKVEKALKGPISASNSTGKPEDLSNDD